MVLNVFDFKTVVLEQDSVFRVETGLEILSVEDRLEFSQELKRLINVGAVLKVFVDVVLEFRLNS